MVNYDDHRLLEHWEIMDTKDSSYKDNIFNSVSTEFDDFNDAQRLSIIGYSILILLSLIGNIIVLVYLTLQKSTSRIKTMFIHFFTSHLFVIFLMMPIEIGWAITTSWKGSDELCRAMAFFRTFGFYLTSYLLVCIAIDIQRYLLKPMNISGIDKKGKILVLFAWIIAIIYSLPQSFLFHVEVHPAINTFRQCGTFMNSVNYELVYSFMVMIFMFITPLLIMLINYSSVYNKIFKNRCANENKFRFNLSLEEIQTRYDVFWMGITMTTVFVICWTPFFLLSILYWIDVEKTSKIDTRIQKGLFLFACSNSCFSPFVYLLYNFFNIKKQTIH